MTQIPTQTPVATELTDRDLDQISGGAAYIKFDGIDGEVLTKPKTPGLTGAALRLAKP